MRQPGHAQRQAPHEAAGSEVERDELHGGEVTIAGLPRLAREAEVRDVVDDGEALGEPLGARLPQRGRAAVGAQAREAARRRRAQLEAKGSDDKELRRGEGSGVSGRGKGRNSAAGAVERAILARRRRRADDLLVAGGRDI